ncbi:unnamed protein product [Rotaria magnacalcarata]|uniref:Uncharacterized protein n=1 Tax=Rotaria magnacalcarata TaxID=392030 RepID=A0A817A1E9_9BILA|nr:unnamed protein product [Rotaria magnacalcarata]CAF4285377.1 unnamed protein product [Rotaria magnacalcarata]
MASSSSSLSSKSIKRSIDNIEPSKENISPNKKMHLEDTSFQRKILDMFKDVGLTAPTQLLDLVDRFHRSSLNRCDKDRRKELYKNLSWYLDRRNVRDCGQAYVLPAVFNDLIRREYPEGVQNYSEVKTIKNGKLVLVKEEDKCYVQLSDFCK